MDQSFAHTTTFQPRIPLQSLGSPAAAWSHREPIGDTLSVLLQFNSLGISLLNGTFRPIDQRLLIVWRPWRKGPPALPQLGN